MTKVKMSEKESNKWSLAHGLPGLYAGLLLLPLHSQTSALKEEDSSSAPRT